VVDVDFAGVTFPDLLQTRGLYQVKRDLPFVPGAEAGGRVRVAPAGCGMRPGDRVAVLTADGAWQEVVVAEPARVLPLPDALPAERAAGMLVNHLTAHFALCRRASARPGESVLVHGAGGGLGTAALELCRALGLSTIAVVSSDRKAEAARRAGAGHVVSAEGWLQAVRAYTAGRGVDVVLDPVGGERFTDSLRSLAPEGRLVVLGFAGGGIPSVKVNRLLLRNTAVLGAGWGEIVAQEPGYLRRQWDELRALVQDGRLTVSAPEVHPLSDAAEVLRRIERREAVGKSVLRVRPTVSLSRGTEN